jgi:hypothetical protein
MPEMREPEGEEETPEMVEMEQGDPIFIVVGHALAHVLVMAEQGAILGAAAERPVHPFLIAAAVVAALVIQMPGVAVLVKRAHLEGIQGVVLEALEIIQMETAAMGLVFPQPQEQVVEEERAVLEEQDLVAVGVADAVA